MKRNRFILLFITSVFLAFFFIPGQQLGGIRYKAGDIAVSDIRASKDYLIEDRFLTEKKRAEAEATVPYVYDLDSLAAQEITRRFEKALSLAVTSNGADRQADKAALRASLDKLLGITLTDREYSALQKIRSVTPLLPQINRITGIVYSHRIVSDKRLLTADLSRGIFMQDIKTCEPLGTLDKGAPVLDISEARKLVGEMRITAGIDQSDQEAVKEILSKLLQPNVIFNRDATEDRRLAARNGASPILFQLKRGEMIVRSGERITEDQVRRLAQVFSRQSVYSRITNGLGILSLVLILFYFPYRFARKNIRKFSPDNKDVLLLALIAVFHFGFMRLGLTVSTAMGGMQSFNNSSIFFFLFPFAVAPMLVRIILNSEVALVFCAVCAPLSAVMFDGSPLVVIYSFMVGVVGAHGVRHCKDRGVIYTAGLKVSVVSLVLALSFQLYGESLFTVQTIYAALFAMISGLVSATVVTGVIPLIENIFQYTTDMKLLEFSNLNSPLLHDLMVRAPGTYHHSVLVGNLVEAAAETIHANPLMARVAAYYHDIGKISKPLYFIENLANGDNKHDKLSASMSALILIAHVKEGVESAKEHRLGQSIIDIIRQSHGTNLITFFYQKAKAHASDPQSLNEQDFRYPGPKPQTREAGLVLLADAVEAASRTLTGPTSARIQGMVQKIINNIFIDGQLDECELTLKDLHQIAKSFNMVLTGIFHHRIDYPEPAYKEKISTGRKPVEDSDTKPPTLPADRSQAPKKNGGEDLKRLGIRR